MRLIVLILGAGAQGDRARSNILFDDGSHEDSISSFGLKSWHYMINIHLAFGISYQCNWPYENWEIEVGVPKWPASKTREKDSGPACRTMPPTYELFVWIFSYPAD
jgi:hypothetical protein